MVSVSAPTVKSTQKIGKKRRKVRKNYEFPKSQFKFLSVVLSLLILSVGAQSDHVFDAASIDTISTHKVNKRFISISNAEHDKGASAFAISATSDGLLYKIPRIVTNTAPFTVTGITNYKARNAVFVSQEYVFLLNEENSKIHYYLLKLNSGSATTLDKVTGDTNTGELTYSATSGQSRIFAYPIKEGNDRLILVFNQGVQFLRFDSTTNSLKSYGTAGNFPAGGNREFLNGIVLNGIGDRYYLIFVAKDSSQTAPNQVRLESYILQVFGSSHESIPLSPTLSIVDTRPWTSRFIISRTGMKKYSGFPEADRYQMTFYYTSLPTRYGAMGVSEQGMFNWESGLTYTTSDFELITGIIGIPNTNHLFGAGHYRGVNWTPGTSWGSQKSATVNARVRAKSVPNSFSRSFRLNTHMTANFPIGDFFAIGDDAHLITVGNFGDNAVDPDNIFYIKSVLNFGCNDNQVQKTSATYCNAQAGFLRPFCSKVDGVIYTCLECNAPSGSTTYSLVDRFDYLYTTVRKVCKPSTTSCTPPNYIASNAASCYNCPSQYPNCKTCFNYNEGCKECNPGYGLINKDAGDLYKCKACSTVHAQCATCQEEAASDNFECLSCNPGWLLKDKTTCVGSCDGGTNPQCGGCSGDGNTCLSCNPGYEFVSNTDKFCRKSCPAGQYWKGKSDNTCGLCSATHAQCTACPV